MIIILISRPDLRDGVYRSTVLVVYESKGESQPKTIVSKRESIHVHLDDTTRALVIRKIIIIRTCKILNPLDFLP